VGVNLGVAILTMGTRPKELAELLASVDAQSVKAVRTVVVVQGCEPPELPPWVQTVVLAENLGVTGGPASSSTPSPAADRPASPRSEKADTSWAPSFPRTTPRSPTSGCAQN
jgi:hypothetical protein